ncbi:DUF2203 domain-containing protein [bacterium]|jgi:hypothetical protein|nr:DUF2203 domain-containing protein [Verrucomicrobiota bacterium]MDA7497260.1 DUF2203 domain-containing protein [bacterium]MDA7511598.1 DUF2203 domain-containing protein [Verrucomicrobiota bacterium]MDA7633748.1 DUF2203 domain-containing protein [bacterium]MDA7866856.1 DUF2203 domain-containing protein [Verrucomicrobiota bacterium]
MTYQFSKHYSIAEARELLPQVQSWIDELLTLRSTLGKVDQLLEGRLRTGEDLGGNTVNDRTRTIARFQAILGEFQTHEIQLKDLDRGLVDFPHLRAGDEVFLCWESGEEDIDYWHDLGTGFAGRELL